MKLYEFINTNNLPIKVRVHRLLKQKALVTPYYPKDEMPPLMLRKSPFWVDRSELKEL